MNDVLKIFFSLSLSGSLLILALFICKPFFKEKISRQWQYYIWLVVVLRLLLPFAPEPGLVGSAFQGAPAALQTAPAPSQRPDIQGFAAAQAGDAQPYNGEAAVPQAPPRPANPLGDMAAVIKNNIWLAWLTAALMLIIRKITIYQSFVSYVKAGQTPVEDTALLDSAALISEQAGVKRAVELCVNPLVSSPLLLGFFKPCIVLPSVQISENDFKYTVLHELTHYRRRDMFYKWLVQLTICLHWFNPLVYLMGREINKACEFSCDEAVVSRLERDNLQGYGKTLLEAMSAAGKYKEGLAAVTLSENKEFLKERLSAIMGFKKKPLMTVCISGVLVSLFLCGAVFAGAYTGENTSAPENNAAQQEKYDVRPDENAAKQPSSPDTTAAGALTMVKKEYTMSDIKSLNISGLIVNVLSENVLIKRGGKVLRVQYYAGAQGGYTLQNEPDGGGTRENLCLQRVTPPSPDEAARNITITIPDELELKVIKAATSSGSISLENCTAAMFMGAETQNGQITINGGTASEFFNIKTENGNAIIRETVLCDGDYTAFETKSGTIAFRPKDGAQNYNILADTGAAAKITINGREYGGGNYETNAGAAKEIDFQSPSGFLIVQDLSAGRLEETLPSQAEILADSFDTAPGEAAAIETLDFRGKTYYF